MGIAILGHFGGKKSFNDGQTVKTVALYDALMRNSIDVEKVDTYYVKKNPVLFCCQFVRMLIKDQQIIVLLSSNGRRMFFPVLYFLSKYFGKGIYHYGIGGRLAREIQENEHIKKYVRSFEGNWMESHILAENLNKLGITNAVYVPNFKKLKVLSPDDLAVEVTKPYKFCTFSRVMEEKGIGDAVAAIEEINRRSGQCLAKLDIYGPVEPDYRDRLEAMLKVSQACRYCGVVNASQSVEIIMGYYCLVFPTHWKHEGIPGTIIDALSAGVPIISRKWQYCTEMIEDKKTGLIYPFEEPDKLVDAIEYAVSHQANILEMRKNCLKKANEYREEVVIKQILSLLHMNQREETV